MRIALMTNNYLPFVGGVSISIERLAEGLKKEGHEVVVFAPSYKECKEEESNVRYAALHTGICGGVSVPIPIDPNIEAVFKEKPFDIIHVHHPMLIGKMAAYLSAKYRVPLVYTYHTRYEQYAHYVLPGKVLNHRKTVCVTEKLIAGYMEHFLKKCHHVFVPTKGMETYLTDNCNYNKDRISTLPTGLSQNSFLVEKKKVQEIHKKYQTENCPLFISVSRLAKEKNIPFLFRSISCFKEKYQKPFKMLLVGEGPDKEMLSELAINLGIGEEIVFTGKIPNTELKDYYGAADAFVFASKSETQGIVLLEAFAAGTPAVCVEATGISDLLQDRKNGFLVTEDTEQFADKLKKIVTEQGLREQMAWEALQTAQCFSENYIAKEAVRQYNKVVAEYHCEAVLEYDKRAWTEQPLSVKW